MRRERVAAKFNGVEFDRLYSEAWTQAPDDHPHLENCPNPWVYWDHIIAMGKGFGKVRSIADMSCGDATVARALAEYSGIEPILGDYAAGYQYQGLLTQTVPKLSVVELFVCTNTIEHLDDPDNDLKLIREHCEKMLLSCPVEEWNEPSGGHYWAWDREAVEAMLEEAGFKVSAYTELDLTPFWNPHCKHGIWACR